ncbi:MAG: ribosome recycling factor [Phycisphaerae bacterium]|nr:ribosome recycling factor [Phycisphaerae bacterium]NUQ47860.1 ribosome recycling factor [Phycisphaerae bacterium]
MSVDEIEFEAEERMEKAVDYLKGEFRGVRTGRASPGLVEHLKINVPSYGDAPMDLRSLATISTPEPTMILIKPFDPTTLKDIERGIQASGIGINPQSDGKVIRLPIPPLSGERRQQIIGQIRKMAEAQRVAIRNVRRESIQKVDTGKKAGDVPEDDAKKSTERLDNLTKKYEKDIDAMLAAKTKEVEQV